MHGHLGVDITHWVTPLQSQGTVWYQSCEGILDVIAADVGDIG